MGIRQINNIMVEAKETINKNAKKWYDCLLCPSYEHL